MKKKIKTILWIFLFVLAIAGISVKDVKASTIASGTCGTNLTWVIADNTLTISGTGHMTNYNESSTKPWDNYDDKFQTINIEYGVTSIGDYAFYGCCYNLKNISIANTVESIGSHAFGCCYVIQKIQLPSSVKTIGQYAFYDCENLKEISLSYGLQTIQDYAFYFCEKLNNISIPYTTTYIGNGAFEHCNTLSSIIIPGSIKEIGNSCFKDCDNLSSVTLSNGLNIIGDFAFSQCKLLNSIIIPSTVYYIGSCIIDADKKASYPSLYVASKSLRGLECQDEYVNIIQYSGYTDDHVLIIVPGTTLTSVKNVKTRKLSIKWQKNTSVNGYVIQMSTNKAFTSGVIQKMVYNNQKVSLKSQKLKKKKTYYVRLCTYTVVNGQIYYSNWSNVKKVKIKK